MLAFIRKKFNRNLMDRGEVMKQFVFGTILLFWIVPVAHAEAKGHCGEMVKEAQQAVDHGKAGHINVLVEHAEAMIKHGTECEKESTAKDHVKEALKHEGEAVEHGKAGHLDVALHHAEGALTHAKEATK